MAVTVSTLVSSCPAPVSDAAGVTNALTWLALVHDFALSTDNRTLQNRHTVINYSIIYFNQIKIADTDYALINNELMHIKLLLTAQQTLDQG